MNKGQFCFVVFIAVVFVLWSLPLTTQLPLITVDRSTDTHVEIWKESLSYYLFKVGYRQMWTYHRCDNLFPLDTGQWNVTVTWEPEGEN